nr:hypothetical protein [Desulfosporosinus meridiei]
MGRDGSLTGYVGGLPVKQYFIGVGETLCLIYSILIMEKRKSSG